MCSHVLSNLRTLLKLLFIRVCLPIQPILGYTPWQSSISILMSGLQVHMQSCSTFASHPARGWPWQRLCCWKPVNGCNVTCSMTWEAGASAQSVLYLCLVCAEDCKKIDTIWSISIRLEHTYLHSSQPLHTLPPGSFVSILHSHILCVCLQGAFEPLICLETKKDYLPAMVRSECFSEHMDFTSMYTVVLYFEWV